MGRRPLKHGIERLISYDETFETTTYRNGLRNGPYKRGAVSGQYVDDLKEGVWTAFDRTMTWHRGKLDGPYEIRLPPLHRQPHRNSSGLSRAIRPGRRLNLSRAMFHLVFSQGRTDRVQRQAGDEPCFFDLLASETDAIDGRISAELERLTQIDIVEMPVKDVALYLAKTHRIPIVVDPKLGSRMDQPITCEYHSIDLCSALTLITAEFDLACDYRFGNVWITTLKVPRIGTIRPASPRFNP